MDLEAQFAPNTLLRLQNSKLASHFSSLIEYTVSQQGSVIAVHNHILNQVHDGAIPPFIFGLWLPLFLRHEPSMLRSVLLDTESRGVRDAGMKVMKRSLKGKQWKEEAWGAAGGTEGLKQIFETFGVWESRELARIIGASNATKDPEKAAAIDELIQLLMPSLLQTSDPDSESSDQHSQTRPLLHELLLLAQGCTSEFLAKCLSNPRFPSHLTDRVVCKLGHQHRDLLRMIAIGSTAVSSKVRELVLRSCLPDLITSTVPWKPEHILPAVSPGVPPGMRFLLDLIYETRTNAPSGGCLSKNVLLGHVITTVDLAVRRKVLFRDILVLLELGLSVADTRAGCSIGLGDQLLIRLVHYWAVAAFPNSEPHIELDISFIARKRQLAHPSRPKPEHRDSLEALLIQVVKAVPEYKIRCSTLDQALRTLMLQRLQEDFPSAAKLPLIKILCRHLPNICVDLDLAVPSENERLHLRWDIEVLGSLPCPDAKWLFERAVSMRPVEQVITSSTSPWSSLLNVDKAVYVAQLWDIKWQAESEPIGERTNPMARKLLEDVKLKAERQRDPYERLEFSQIALGVAVISKSVRLLKEVCGWARRYLADPNVSGTLQHDLVSDNTAPIISCATSSTLKSSVSLSKLSSLVQEANSLLSLHLQTALLVLREPSYQYCPFNRVFSLLRRVVSLRIDGIRKRLRLGLESEDDLVETFLRSLIPIILEFERAGTAEGHERLGWGQIDGPLGGLDCPNSPSGPVLSFLDDLAKQRDELWNHVRIEREPKVAAIGAGWPKGLPVQSLLPSKNWAAVALRNADAAPFATARVEGTVFCNPETSLQAIPDETSHIGPFCDSLKYSITCYIGNKSSAGLENRLSKVWAHYSEVVPSSAGHILELGQWLSKTAASRGCTNVAKRINRAIYPSQPEISQLPSADGEAVEWDPWPEAHRGNSSSKPTNTDRPTILNSRFHVPTWKASISSSFEDPPPWKVSDTPKILDIWNSATSVRILPLPTQEAILVSAILYLDSLNTGSTRLLSKPFPEGAIRPRYPSVYLDYEFLSSVGKSPDAAKSAIKVLRRLVSIVPPILLRDLAKSLLKTLSDLPDMSPKYAVINSTIMGLVALLPLSDKPVLTVDLGLKIIEDMPDASAWHRQIISLRLGKQLGHKDAEGMMRKFASFVFDTLEQQRKGGKWVADPEPEPESDEDIDMLSDDESRSGSQEDIDMIDGEAPAVSKAPSKSSGRVKITTVKMLAQMLTESNFISLELGRSILVSLFSASHHIDVRRAVAGALLESLRKSEDMGSTGRHAYAALVTLSNAAAGPNERVMTSEAQWREAESGGTLPEVGTERPLFKFFIEEIRNLLPSKYSKAYVRDVVLPLLNESSKQHNRWMRIFLSRIELTPEEKSVVDFGPFGTVDRSEVVLKQWKAYLPKSYLLQHRVWALSHLICHKLENINDKLTLHDREWPNTEAGKYWKRYFTTNKAGKEPGYWGKLLEFGAITLVKDGITDQDVMDEFCAEAAIMIREPYNFPSQETKSKISLDQFNDMIRQLQIPLADARTRIYSFSGTSQESWRSRIRPVLERIVADIESIRSSDTWAKNPDRKPAILPPKIQFQTQLLPYPHIDLHPRISKKDEYQSRKNRQEEFLSCILSLLDEVVSSPSCLSDFEWLEGSMNNIDKEDLPPSVRGLAKSLENGGDSFKDCLKVKLIYAAFQKLRRGSWLPIGQWQMKGVKTMLAGEWKKSPNEWVRSVAWKLASEV